MTIIIYLLLGAFGYLICLAFVVALCQAAKRGDELLERLPRPGNEPRKPMKTLESVQRQYADGCRAAAKDWLEIHDVLEPSDPDLARFALLRAADNLDTA